jgi:hypothetical protein
MYLKPLLCYNVYMNWLFVFWLAAMLTTAYAVWWDFHHRGKGWREEGEDYRETEESRDY